MCRSKGYESLLSTGLPLRIVLIERNTETTAVNSLCVRHHYEQTQSINIGLCDEVKLDVTRDIPRGGIKARCWLKLNRSRHASSLHKQPARWIHHVVSRNGGLNSGGYCLRSVRCIANQELREVGPHLIAFGETAEDCLQSDDITGARHLPQRRHRLCGKSEWLWPCRHSRRHYFKRR